MVTNQKDYKNAKRKPYICHDPVVGYRYIPDTKMDLKAPDGSKYVLKINSMGIRSDKQYSAKKPQNTFRILVLGDSMVAGQYVENKDRFTERLEGIFEGTEFINLGLEGTGTDQQFLIFKHYASLLEYDAILLCPFIENIRRNVVRYRLTVDLKSDRWILSPKPQLKKKQDGTWGWVGIPVPEKRPFYDEAQPSTLKDTDFGGSEVTYKLKDAFKAALSRALEKTHTKGLLYSLIKHEPYGEYKDSLSMGWQTMKAILAEFKKLAGDKQFIIAPVPTYSYLRYNLADMYKRRFREECENFLDILPHLKTLSRNDQKRCFISKDCHFSTFGHQETAKAIAKELKKLTILTAKGKNR